MKDADKAIIGKLKEAGRIVNVAVEHHSYPFCWRSETPLIYKVSGALVLTNRVEAVTPGHSLLHSTRGRHMHGGATDCTILYCRRCPAGL